MPETGDEEKGDEGVFEYVQPEADQLPEDSKLGLGPPSGPPAVCHGGFLGATLRERKPGPAPPGGIFSQCHKIRAGIFGRKTSLSHPLKPS